MDSFYLALTIICVIAISCGQILFKRVGLELQALDNWLHWKVLLLTALAFLIYGSASLLWIYTLRNIDLSKAYMIMALSFVIVPIASSFFFGEKLSLNFLGGMALIISGIVVVVKYG